MAIKEQKNEALGKDSSNELLDLMKESSSRQIDYISTQLGQLKARVEIGFLDNSAVIELTEEQLKEIHSETVKIRGKLQENFKKVNDASSLRAFEEQLADFNVEMEKVLAPYQTKGGNPEYMLPTGTMQKIDKSIKAMSIGKFTQKMEVTVSYADSKNFSGVGSDKMINTDGKEINPTPADLILALKMFRSKKKKLPRMEGTNSQSCFSKIKNLFKTKYGKEEKGMACQIARDRQNKFDELIDKMLRGQINKLDILFDSPQDRKDFHEYLAKAISKNAESLNKEESVVKTGLSISEEVEKHEETEVTKADQQYKKSGEDASKGIDNPAIEKEKDPSGMQGMMPPSFE